MRLMTTSLVILACFACGGATAVTTDAGNVDASPSSNCPDTLPQHVACTRATGVGERICSYGSMGCFCAGVQNASGAFSDEWICKIPRCYYSDGGTPAVNAPVGGTPCDSTSPDATVNGICVYSDSPRVICVCRDSKWQC